ncbi:MAG: CAP domain-containing protein [Alphaproteobacteria bacterium]|nr:CAP domain-containing protein [Alphaproteobacteria bacterium]
MALLLPFFGHIPVAAAMDAIWQSDILFHVNAARAAQGLAPLQWNARLAEAATAHAADLQRCAKLAHEGCDGNQLPQRAARAGYAFRRISENLALCPCDAAAVVPLWLNSEGHRRNLLDPNVTELGADTRLDEADLRRQQWVLVMGRQ